MGEPTVDRANRAHDSGHPASLGGLEQSLLPRLPRQIQCILLAVAFVCLLFADVIFRGGSLSPLDYDPVLASERPSPPPVSLLPERGRQITDGWGDTGSAIF